ncbi:MAG: hypothetical protein RI920_1624, partial [Pseudomonadota bacterium]
KAQHFEAEQGVLGRRGAVQWVHSLDTKARNQGAFSGPPE